MDRPAQVKSMASSERIRAIEEVASRAWPAKHRQQYGGWLLRATEGVTRRANSVLPLGNPPEAQLDKALKTVETFYQQYRLPMRFQLTTTSQPPNLDEALENNALIMDMRVEVHTAPLNSVVVEEPQVGIVIFGSLNRDWLQAYGRFAGYDKVTLKVRQGIMERITQEKAFATAVIGDSIVGTGLGVIDGIWLGLFGLIVDKNHRREGIATVITQNLVTWALNHGASHGYLQVEEHNDPAKALYSTLGFKETYTYWYRVAQE